MHTLFQIFWNNALWYSSTKAGDFTSYVRLEHRRVYIRVEIHRVLEQCGHALELCVVSQNLCSERRNILCIWTPQGTEQSCWIKCHTSSVSRASMSVREKLKETEVIIWLLNLRDHNTDKTQRFSYCCSIPQQETEWIMPLKNTSAPTFPVACRAKDIMNVKEVKWKLHQQSLIKTAILILWNIILCHVSSKAIFRWRAKWIKAVQWK